MICSKKRAKIKRRTDSLGLGKLSLTYYVFPSPPASYISMESLPVKTIRSLETQAKKLGLDERILIENASSNLACLIDQLNLGNRALIIAGRGNNGADVLSCARKMLSRGYKVRLAVVSDKPLGGEATFQKEVLEGIGVKFCSIESSQQLSQLCKGCDFILEGIVGIGIKGEVSAYISDIIKAINASGKKIISCDIPSGLSPDEGVILGVAIKADYTISFIAAKKGFFMNQGPAHCGKIHVVDIGISKELIKGPS